MMRLARLDQVSVNAKWRYARPQKSALQYAGRHAEQIARSSEPAKFSKKVVQKIKEVYDQPARYRRNADRYDGLEH